MSSDKWITGEELLVRWDMQPFELVTTVKTGQLMPYFKLTGARRSLEADPCLYCAPPVKHEGLCVPPPCSKRPAEPSAWRGGCHKGDTATQALNLIKAQFLFSEVQSFEQAHGMRAWTQADHAAANTGTLTEMPLAAGITGAMIERRWQGYGLDLLAALRSGELAPVDKIVAPGETCGPRRTKEMDPCLYCEDGPVGCECEHLKQDDFCTHWNHEGRMFRVRHAIFLRHEVIGYELSKGATIRDESQNEQLQLVVAADVIKPDQVQQVEKSGHGFKTPRDHAKYLLKENPSKGLAMLEIERCWKMKKFEAAAYVLGRALPDDDDENEKRRLGGQWRYHTKLLDDGD